MEPKSTPSPRIDRRNDADDLNSPPSLLRRREAYFGRPPTPSDTNNSRVVSPSSSRVVSAESLPTPRTGSAAPPTTDPSQAPSIPATNKLQATADPFQITTSTSKLRAEAPEFFPRNRLTGFGGRETWLEARSRLMREARTYAVPRFNWQRYANDYMEPNQGGDAMAPAQATEGKRRKKHRRNNADFGDQRGPRWMYDRGGRGNGRGSGGAGSVGLSGGW